MAGLNTSSPTERNIGCNRVRLRAPESVPENQDAMEERVKVEVRKLKRGELGISEGPNNEN